MQLLWKNIYCLKVTVAFFVEPDDYESNLKTLWREPYSTCGALLLWNIAYYLFTWLDVNHNNAVGVRF